MTFPDAVHSVLGQYAGFRGRAPRSEFWWWYLFTVLVNLLTTAIDRLTDAALGFSFLGTVVSLGLLLPTLAVSVRRLHDSDLSGWWLLAPISAGLVGVGCLVAGVVAVVAGAFMGTVDQASALGVVLLAGGGLAVLAALVIHLVLMLRRGTPGPNRFGPAGAEPSSPYGYPPSGGYGYPESFHRAP